MRCIAVCGFAFVLLATAAVAQDRSSPIPSHLPLATEACFGRVYDAKHLADHPKQRVTSFHVFRDFTPDYSAETVVNTPDALKQMDGEQGILMTAFVRFRDRPGLFWNGFFCRRIEKGETFCGIECDGGAFKLKAAGPSLLLENEGFVVIGGCGASEDEREQEDYVKPGADDRVFRLDPKPVNECRALEDSRKPAWAKLGPPLRERLGREGSVCFSRTYDAAHLSKHPQQQVRRIDVIKAAGTKSDDPESPRYDLIFRVETRDGKRHENKINCFADKYAFACTSNLDSDTDQDFYLTRAGDQHAMLRDRRGRLSKFLKAKLGSDDRIFRLQQVPAESCRS